MKTVILLLKTHTKFCKRNGNVGAAILVLCCNLVNFLRAFSHFLVQMSPKGHTAKTEVCFLYYIHTYFYMHV